MYEGKTIGVVVPAHNEEGLIGEVITTIPEFVDRVFVIDDCSSDATWEQIQRAVERVNASPNVAKADGGQIQSRVIPHRHETNKGVGGAIKTGYELAVQEGMDVVAVMNGDGQMDPDILDEIIEPVVDGRADYSKGNRLYSAEHYRGMSRWRFTGNALLTFMTKIASGYWGMNDPQNGYTAISRQALETLEIDDLYDDYGFLNDLVVKLNVHGFRITDVEMRAVYGEEESGIRYRSFVPKLSKLLLVRFLWRLKTRYLVADFHPLVLLYGLGPLGMLVGLGSIGWATLEGGLTVVSAQLGILVFLFSCFITVLAMTMDMEYNNSLERHARL
ncbi:glycosyltransferase family 2 protein [Halosimplex pelagicum]|uniref:Glycosyltransferase family 2 protein n=1 Tax=Halosimplex pelagicum TaxID=869886 RepID=A0A7D5P7K1_9EURY|nr:glycosyltransferase family 2 protein [Halosimplex pelagicum]QLH81181.1 glycosyltransferase family 2 protein [Halosimplex pelagicum]